jgi:hypothetical protein
MWIRWSGSLQANAFFNNFELIDLDLYVSSFRTVFICNINEIILSQVSRSVARSWQAHKLISRVHDVDLLMLSEGDIREVYILHVFRRCTNDFLAGPLSMDF